MRNRLIVRRGRGHQLTAMTCLSALACQPSATGKVTVPTFNAPPGWDTPTDPTWTPPRGWEPKPWWPPAPSGWQFWIPDPILPPTPVQRVPVVSRLHLDQSVVPTTFWTFKMDRSQWTAFAVTLAVLAVGGGLLLWNQARITRADRVEAGHARCDQAARDLYPDQNPSLYNDYEVVTATVDGDLVVSVTGTMFVGSQPHVSYSCTIRHDGVWSDMDGWRVPVVVSHC